MAVVILLGPQRFNPNVRETIDSLGVQGPLAVVTAGWQEREAEDDELRQHVQRDVVDLMLYNRTDDVLARDPEFAEALDRRKRRLKRLQTLYRLRLAHTLQPARELMAREDVDRILSDQRRAAIRAVRTLDRQQLRRVTEIHHEFEQRWRPAERPSVARHREKLAEVLAQCGALAIAGGHVAVLINRLRLFDVVSLIGDLPVIAWSAGAMAASDRVVLFHDSPPQGAGDPEVFEVGLGLAPRVVALPHAQRRLRLDDPIRVALFARRFMPATCVALSPTSRLDFDGRNWSGSTGTLRLGIRGRLTELPAA